MKKLISIRLPEDVLSAVDVMADSESRTRSQVIAMVLRDRLVPTAEEVLQKRRKVGPDGEKEDAAAASKRQGVAAPDTRPSAVPVSAGSAGSSPAPGPSKFDPLLIPGVQRGLPVPEILTPGAVSLCGFRSYNGEDGEYYRCGKPAGHGIKHGEWVKE